MKSELARFGIVLLGCFCLAGCMRPAVAPKPFSMQDSQNSVQDWNGVAQRVADAMTGRGLLAPRPTPGAVTSGVQVARDRMIYVQPLAVGSPFLDQVRTALESEIIARGETVALSPAGATVVNLDVRVINWSGSLRRSAPSLAALGLATGGAYVLGMNGPYTPAAAFGIAAGTGLALELLRALTPDTNVEAVWEASVQTDDRLIMKAHAPVYIQAGDIGLYATRLHFGPRTSYVQPTRLSGVRLRYVP